jgi:hypothetical protein
MIRINKDTAKKIIDNLKTQSYPAYSNWNDYVSLYSLTEKDCIILYSDEIKENFSFKKEEFYILKNLIDNNPIIFGIVFSTPLLEKNKDFSKENYVEVYFIKSPVLEPAGIGEVFFQHQSIKLSQDNKNNILDFLELDIPDKIKDIFLFDINEFLQNGVNK